MILLSAVALAAEPLAPLPDRPPPAEPVTGECTRAMGLDVGEPLPGSLVVDGEAACAAVAVPVSRLADLMASEAWSTAIEDRYHLDVLYLQGQVKVIEAERDWYQKRLEEETEVAVWERPWFQRCVGGTTVMLIAGATIWAIDR